MKHPNKELREKHGKTIEAACKDLGPYFVLDLVAQYINESLVRFKLTGAERRAARYDYAAEFTVLMKEQNTEEEL